MGKDSPFSEVISPRNKWSHFGRFILYGVPLLIAGQPTPPYRTSWSEIAKVHGLHCCLIFIDVSNDFILCVDERQFLALVTLHRTKYIHCTVILVLIVFWHHCSDCTLSIMWIPIEQWKKPACLGYIIGDEILPQLCAIII